MKKLGLHFSIRFKMILIVAGLLFLSLVGSAYLIRSLVFQNILYSPYQYKHLNHKYLIILIIINNFIYISIKFEFLIKPPK